MLQESQALSNHPAHTFFEDLQHYSPMLSYQLKASSTIVPFSLHIMEPSLFSDFWPQCGQAASLQLALQENILSFKSKKQATTTKENQLIKKNTI
uniref:Uncharacterized protein n=1 Tax=Zonotrichia albicollis TaxID=44394 RepID=A0A8D2M507_ZONAL